MGWIFDHLVKYGFEVINHQILILNWGRTYFMFMMAYHDVNQLKYHIFKITICQKWKGAGFIN